MTLIYLFATRYLGSDSLHDEVFTDTIEYEYETDVAFDDIVGFILANIDVEHRKDQGFKEGLKAAYDLDLFCNLEHDAEFIDYMHDTYESAAYKQFKENENGKY